MRLSHTLGVARSYFGFTGIDARGQLVTLGLNKLVGAGLGHAFELVVERLERHSAGQVVAVRIEQAAQRRRRQVAAQLQRARRNHFTDVQQFKQHSARFECLVLDQRDGRIAHRARQHQVHTALHHGVFPGNELHVFA